MESDEWSLENVTGMLGGAIQNHPEGVVQR